MKKVPFAAKARIPESMAKAGVKQESGELLFPDAWTDGEIVRAAKRLGGSAVVQAEMAKAYAATDEDRQKVAEIVGKEDVSGYGIYRVVASSSRRDADGDRLSARVLEEMGKQYAEGRTVAFIHSVPVGIGHTFESELNTQDGETELLVKFYVSPSASLPTGNAKALLDDRVYRRVSIAAYMRMTDYVPSDQDPERRGYYLFDEPESVKVTELSVVHMGANPDAKFASLQPNNLTGDTLQIIQTKSHKNRRQMDELVKIEIAGHTIQVAPDSKATAEAVAKQYQNAKESLQKYKEAETKKADALQAKYLTLAKTLEPEASDATKQRWEKMAKALRSDLDLLAEQVEDMQAKVENHKQRQLDTSGAVRQKAPKSDGESLLDFV